MKLLKLQIYLLFLLTSFQSVSQENLNDLKHLSFMQINDIPSITNKSEVPYFFQLILKKTINIFEIDEAFNDFEEHEKEERLKKGVKKNTEEENPFERFFLLWRSEVDLFINEAGGFDIELFHRWQDHQNKSTIKKENKKQERLTLAKTWKPIGAHTVYRGGVKRPWQQNVYFLAVYKNNTNVQYLGTETGLLFKTTDKGLNWTFRRKISAPIAIHPTNSNKIFIASSTLFTSQDGGLTGVSGFNFGGGNNDIIISENNPNLMFVASSKGVFRSTNQGVNWDKKIDINATDVIFHPTDHSIVYAVSREGVFYKSSDGGTTFVQKPVINGFSAQGTLLGVTQANPSVVYVSALSGKTARVYKSSDIGESFTEKGTLTNFSQGFYDFCLAVNPFNENEILTGMTSLFKSSNSGETFTVMGGYSGPHAIHPDLQWIETVGNETFVATDGGVSYNTDFFQTAVSTEYRSSGIWASHFWGWDHSWNEDLWGGGRYHNGNLVSRGEWGNNAMSIGGAESPAGVSIEGVGFAFRDIKGGKVIKIKKNYLEVGGNEVVKSFTGHPNQYYYGARVGDVTAHPYYSNLLFTTQDNTIKFSTNTGGTFNDLYDFGGKTWEIKIARSNPSRAYVVANGTGNKLYVCENFDNLYSTIWTEIPLPSNKQLYIQVDETNENKLWFCNLTNIYSTLDKGVNWTDISPPGNYNIYRIVKQEGIQDALYAFVYNKDTFTSEVLYRDTTTGGWVDYSTGLIEGHNYGTRLKPFPFYTKSKLRLGTQIGTWEIPFYKDTYQVISQPKSDAFPGACIGDTIKFDSCSVVNQNNVSWEWTFSEPPTTIDSYTIRNPKATFSTSGLKTATLKVTDNDTGLSDTKTINFFIFQDNLTINSLDDPTGINRYYARNIILNTNVPSTAEVYLYFSETFLINKTNFEMNGELYVKKDEFLCD